MEVLVALLVLAIGLLGLAALQAQGLRFSIDSYARTQATALAYDIIDQIRANRTNAATYTVLSSVSGTAATLDGGALPACDPLVASVQNDLACWVDQVNGALPGSTIGIVLNGDPNYLDISLGWADRDAREFSSGTPAVRLPTDSDECLFPDGNNSLTQLNNRQWDGTNSVCMITQTWTIFP